MFHADLVERTYEPTLEQRPEVLDAIGMHVALDVGDAVIDPLMLVRGPQDIVGMELIGIDDLDVGPGPLVNEVLDRLRGHIADLLDAALALDHAQHRGLGAVLARASGLVPPWVRRRSHRPPERP